MASVVATAVGIEVESRLEEGLTPALSASTPSIAMLPADSARRLILSALTNLADSMRVARPLDSTSLLVRFRDGRMLYGRTLPPRLPRAIVAGRGPMAGLVSEIALRPDQIPSAFRITGSPIAALHFALLFCATVIATVLAVGLSRRETTLARTRGDFIAGVSHDFRMPLAQILLAAETLEMHDDLENSEWRGLTTSIVRESRRLVALVDNVLFFSRSGVSRLGAQSEGVQVDDLFADVFDSVYLAANDARQTVDVQLRTGLVIAGNRRLLRQALVNLIDNSLKYGPPGQTIRVTATPAPAGRVHIAVEDRGPGIPVSDRQRVLEPYERLDRDQSSERTGAGLGLAVTRNIAQACGGRIIFDDAPEGGTRAILDLAAAADEAP